MQKTLEKDTGGLANEYAQLACAPVAAATALDALLGRLASLKRKVRRCALPIGPARSSGRPPCPRHAVCSLSAA